jgi:hypothetical protein
MTKHWLEKVTTVEAQMEAADVVVAHKPDIVSERCRITTCSLTHRKISCRRCRRPSEHETYKAFPTITSSFVVRNLKRRTKKERENSTVWSVACFVWIVWKVWSVSEFVLKVWKGWKVWSIRLECGFSGLDGLECCFGEQSCSPPKWKMLYIVRLNIILLSQE